MNNEIMVNQETGEILPTEKVINETEDYKIIQLEDGSFKKNMKYKEFSSFVPETKEEKIELYKVFNDSDDELVTPLRNAVNKEITIAHVFTSPYQSFDETTGVVTDGVTTTIKDVNGQYFATSSKSVYHKVASLLKAFGNPRDENYRPITVKVTGTKQKNGLQIDLSLVGIE